MYGQLRSPILGPLQCQREEMMGIEELFSLKSSHGCGCGPLSMHGMASAFIFMLPFVVMKN